MYHRVYTQGGIYQGVPQGVPQGVHGGIYQGVPQGVPGWVYPGCMRGHNEARRGQLPRAALIPVSLLASSQASVPFPLHCWPVLRLLVTFPFHCWPIVPASCLFPASLLASNRGMLGGGYLPTHHGRYSLPPCIYASSTPLVGSLPVYMDQPALRCVRNEEGARV